MDIGGEWRALCADLPPSPAYQSPSADGASALRPADVDRRADGGMVIKVGRVVDGESDVITGVTDPSLEEPPSDPIPDATPVSRLAIRANDQIRITENAELG